MVLLLLFVIINVIVIIMVTFFRKGVVMECEVLSKGCCSKHPYPSQVVFAGGVVQSRKVLVQSRGLKRGVVRVVGSLGKLL